MDCRAIDIAHRIDGAAHARTPSICAYLIGQNVRWLGDVPLRWLPMYVQSSDPPAEITFECFDATAAHCRGACFLFVRGPLATAHRRASRSDAQPSLDGQPQIMEDQRGHDPDQGLQKGTIWWAACITNRLSWQRLIPADPIIRQRFYAECQ